jgi:hypothetical protein
VFLLTLVPSYKKERKVTAGTCLETLEFILHLDISFETSRLPLSVLLGRISSIFSCSFPQYDCTT